MQKPLFRPVRAAVLAVLLAGTLTPASAQSVRPTAPEASAMDAPETAGFRRRPMPRAQARAAADSTFRSVSSSRGARAWDVAGSAAERSLMIASVVRVEMASWLGTPYRWGGTSRRGIDCSAFTRELARASFGIELPRNTAGQQFEGVPVSRHELIAGDLVFFRRGGVRHVGVYLGDGDFVHASSSRGVTVSNLSEGYYARHYWMARRILSEPSGRRPTPRMLPAPDAGVRG